MRVRLFVLLLAACVFTLDATAGSTGTLSADRVMEKNFYASKVKTLEATATMELINANGQMRERKFQMLTKLRENGVDVRIRTRFYYPADIRGTTFVEVENADRDDDLWIYIPALRKVRRLVANNKRDSFVGSDFSYGDILPARPSSFRHILLGSATVEDHECYVIQSTPLEAGQRDDLGYAKKVTWVREDNFLEAKVEYYDLRGTLIKTQTTTDHKLVDPDHAKWLATRREMINKQSGHRTVVVLDHLVVGGVVQDVVFSPSSLDQ